MKHKMNNIKAGPSTDLIQPPRKRLRLSRASTAASESSPNSPKLNQRDRIDETSIPTRASTETEVLGSSVSHAFDIDDDIEATSPSTAGSPTLTTPTARSGRIRGRPRSAVATGTKRKTRASSKLEAEASAQILLPIDSEPSKGPLITVRNHLDLLARVATWKSPGKIPQCAFCQSVAVSSLESPISIC